MDDIPEECEGRNPATRLRINDRVCQPFLSLYCLGQSQARTFLDFLGGCV